MLNPLELTGRTETHVEKVVGLPGALHRSTLESLTAMREAAGADGIELEVVSTFRSFDRQAAIWNAKFTGARPLLDRQSRQIDRSGFDGGATIDAILLWSALPGASRHHWGTDIDVIDRAAITDGYVPQLVQSEFAAGAVFERLAAWLDANLSRFAFFRPYTTDRGGVLPEPWHLSYAPVSVPALEAFSLEVLTDAVSTSNMQGRDLVLARLPELYQRYVRNVDEPAWRIHCQTRRS